MLQVPWLALLLCAIGIFIYQALDAIDGKQARRTRSNTPLGELFDHGCDSLSTGESLPDDASLHHRSECVSIYIAYVAKLPLGGVFFTLGVPVPSGGIFRDCPCT